MFESLFLHASAFDPGVFFGHFFVHLQMQGGRSFTVRVPRVWSPHGADRLFNLVRAGWFTDTRFYRVVSGFVAQFGMQGQPAVDAPWREPEAQVMYGGNVCIAFLYPAASPVPTDAWLFSDPQPTAPLLHALPTAAE